jgi:ADP-ribosylglycohydrolase
MAPYNSFGNGSAMRVSPVGWYFSTMQETLCWAEISARVSHNHPEGIKAAQATASAIFMARGGQTKVRIRQEIEAAFGYNLSQTLDSIRPGYQHDVTAAGSVPQAIIAFLESDGFEDAIRNAVSLGGDSDTQGAIAGSIAEAAYGIPASIRTEALARLAPPMLGVVDRWESALARRESV